MQQLNQILSALLAIVVGVGGSLLLFVALDRAIRLLPERAEARLRPWVYIGPALLILAVYLLYPTATTVYWSLFGPRSREFVGLANYAYALGSPDLHIAFRNNLLWIVVVTLGSVGLGLLVAVLVDRVRYEAAAKTLIFLPMAISAVGAAVIWRFVYEYRPPGTPQIGLLNGLLAAARINPVPWLVNLWTDNFALMAIQIWLMTGFCMVVISAALKSIPKEVLEAARVDGANELQIFWRVIVPMVSSTIAVVATTVVIGVLKVFDIVLVMTNGNFETEVIANRMYKEMFQFRDFGHASAIAVILLLAIVPVMVINIRRFQQQEALR
jgi:alpha-glucoside transport system permease protein